ncbi:hypothetical protein BTS2_2607 [Bacillus sp. TS-2]|nr:hypothetical protein BTS2_2607 [Bacillus sp. TS-2]
MKLAIKVMGGALLIFIGLSIILSLLGIHLGGLFGLIVGASLLYWGYTRYKENNEWSVTTIIIIAAGVLMIFGGIGGIISLLIGLLLLYGGYELIKGKKEKDESFDVQYEESIVTKSHYDPLDEEFNRLMKK